MAAKKQCMLFVTLHIKRDQTDAFKTAHRPVWAACAAEPEYLLFDVFPNPGEPGRFRFIEVWNESREWFETQQLTEPYFENLWRRTKLTLKREPELEYFEREGEGCSFRQGYLDGGKKME